MHENRGDWLQLASTISSVRQMYFLSERIVRSTAASRNDRRAARRVIDVLSGVIDQPIAAAATLIKARRRFGNLVKSLQMDAGRACFATPAMQMGPDADVSDEAGSSSPGRRLPQRH